MRYFYYFILLCFTSTLCYAEDTGNITPIRLSLSSPAFDHEAAIPMEYTCDGQNISPPLTIDGVNKRARSLMLFAVDKEASTPPHQAVIWFMYNIPPQTKTISSDQIPELSLVGRNSDGTQAYQSPCPKGGMHHYYFILYALDKVLPETTTSLEEASSLIKDHIVGYASLMGTYARK